MNDIRDIRNLFETYNTVAGELGTEIDLRISLTNVEEFRELAVSGAGITEKK